MTTPTQEEVEEAMKWVEKQRSAGTYPNVLAAEVLRLREKLARHKTTDDRAFDLAGEVPDLKDKIITLSIELEAARKVMARSLDHLQNIQNGGLTLQQIYGMAMQAELEIQRAYDATVPKAVDGGEKQ